MHMIPVGADLQELELIASLDPQTDVSQRLVDRRIEHGSSIFGWKHQVVEQNRNVMALVDVEAHPRDLRRKRRGMHPKGFNQLCQLMADPRSLGLAVVRVTEEDWPLPLLPCPAPSHVARQRLERVGFKVLLRGMNWA